MLILNLSKAYGLNLLPTKPKCNQHLITLRYCNGSIALVLTKWSTNFYHFIRSGSQTFCLVLTLCYLEHSIITINRQSSIYAMCIIYFSFGFANFRMPNLMQAQFPAVLGVWLSSSSLRARNAGSQNRWKSSLNLVKLLLFLRVSICLLKMSFKQYNIKQSIDHVEC